MYKGKKCKSYYNNYYPNVKSYTDRNLYAPYEKTSNYGNLFSDTEDHFRNMTYVYGWPNNHYKPQNQYTSSWGFCNDQSGYSVQNNDKHIYYCSDDKDDRYTVPNQQTLEMNRRKMDQITSMLQDIRQNTY